VATEKAAMFVDNSNIFTRYLSKSGELQSGQYLRMRWEKLIEFLEDQDGGLDLFARHFFASLPPAADVTKLTQRPTEEQWEELVKKSAQTGFYKVIQNPPFNFTLHAVPLRFAEIRCGTRIRQAYFKCLEAYGGNLECDLSLDPEKCYECKKKFLFKYEKGVDVALAAQLVIFGGLKGANLDRVILVAGDGDYKEAIRFVRQEIGRDVQIVSWRRSLARDLENLANKSIIYLDDLWRDFCEIREKPPLDERSASDESGDEEQEE
jgi:uncharacterized LabA/DUF88 family protein